MSEQQALIGLTTEGCYARQERLRAFLNEANLDAALISDPRYVHYFTGYWCRSLFAPHFLFRRTTGSILSVPFPPPDELLKAAPLAADDIDLYESNRIGTLVDHQGAAALCPLASAMKNMSCIGCDRPLFNTQLNTAQQVDISEILLKMRRQKDSDEVGLITEAIRAAEAAYTYAYKRLAAGVTEVELFAGMQAAAVEFVGETIGEFGNDFQIGSVGSAPRRRAAQAGETAIFDVTVVVRGYASDLCRTFVVGREPTEAQMAGRERILEVLQHVEQTVRPGVSCRELYEYAFSRLDGYRGWTFKHHLGHGIGICSHEAPRLNPHWDDVFQIGDVFTAEPGLYGEDLRAGLRIEENFLVTAEGVHRLSQFPTSL